MALRTTPDIDFGWLAPDFTLPATDGAEYSLTDLRGENGTLVVFMCNHCPYVMAVLDKLIRDAKALAEVGVTTIAISSNDVTTYPQDSFENMTKLANAKAFPFPYLYDETQEVARAYDAQCTPDFFGFDAKGGLQYRGRIDASPGIDGDPNAKRELFEAMVQIAQTGEGPREQMPSMGCSIKWKA